VNGEWWTSTIRYSPFAIRPFSLFTIRLFLDRKPHGCARINIDPANHYRPGLRLIFGRKTGMAAPLTAT
jgi:hypothetical protein